MRGRVFLIAGERVDKAGPVLFDPPVSVGQTGFYDVVIGGEGPVLETVKRPLSSPIAELEARVAGLTQELTLAEEEVRRLQEIVDRGSK